MNALQISLYFLTQREFAYHQTQEWEVIKTIRDEAINAEMLSHPSCS